MLSNYFHLNLWWPINILLIYRNFKRSCLKEKCKRNICKPWKLIGITSKKDDADLTVKSSSSLNYIRHSYIKSILNNWSLIKVIPQRRTQSTVNMEWMQYGPSYQNSSPLKVGIWSENWTGTPHPYKDQSIFWSKVYQVPFYILQRRMAHLCEVYDTQTWYQNEVRSFPIPRKTVISLIVIWMLFGPK